MPRSKRITPGGYIYHVLNRANGRLRIFRKNEDFLAFEQILAQAAERFQMRICGWCIMQNHWHLLLWPRNDGDLSNFMRWVTLTHTQRYHTAHGTTGIGHLYQGRFKSFPVQDDNHYLTVLRYIEANPLKAEIVKKPADWPWSSFVRRHDPDSLFELTPGPLKLPRNWEKLVTNPLDPDQSDDLEKSFTRGTPFGDPAWQSKTAKKLSLQSTLNPRGRPKKSE